MTAPAEVPAAVADYEIVRLLGEGNNGRFYLARPPARLGIPDEFVALKVFAERIGEEAYERGVRELQAFAAVRSPYLVRVFDAVLDDRFAYSMEYLPLGSLSAQAGRLERAAVLTALEHAARAAHALHEAGLAHGDISPGNVLVIEGADGGAEPDGVGGRLSDLGLARLLGPGGTLTGMAGTRSVEFVDPEMLAGARPSRRSEVWALGATLHRAVAGTGLFGDLPEDQPLLAFRRVAAGTPTIAPGLDVDVAALVRDCLAAGSARLPTAADVADRLAALRT